MTGWFWFATEKVQEQVIVINGRHVKDTIWLGFVQGFAEVVFRLPPRPTYARRSVGFA